jgi:uncharacterized repeat protein (TIGR03803 family)
MKTEELSVCKFHHWKTACAVSLLCAATAIASPAQTFTTLVNFNGTNGAAPQPEGLVQGIDGNLYGTTFRGGANNSGTVFKMTSAGTLTTLYNFCSQPGCTDGNNPAAALVQATDGNFYGATDSGGTFGDGTVFRIAASGNLTTLHSFDNTDGRDPNSRLFQASDGSFYGTTAFGGDPSECVGNFGCGTVFKITPSGALTTLYKFCSQTGCTDGAVVFLGLAQGRDGNFYGATWGGGPANGGTIFKISAQGTLTTLNTFCVGPGYPFCGGSTPLGLVQGTDGNFYGLTVGFGPGAVIKVTPEGELAILYVFCAKIACADGSTPRGALSLGSDGNFYGTTYYGGTSNQGAVFKITPSGVLTTLHSFHGWDGRYPIGGVSQATNGDFYGSTTSGGSGDDGTIFRLSVEKEE